MTGSKIREKLHLGECVYGTHIASLMNPSAAAIAAGMELDFAFFCTEHMPLDRTEVGLLCRFYAAHGISPIVRVPSPDPISIAMALDGGAEGIVVPYVETVEEVKASAGAVKYRPIKGKLLQDVLDGKRELSEKTREFLPRFNRHNYLIIGVESEAAIDNLENLVTAADVDGVFLGPHDITVSMGIPEEYNNPLFLNTVEDVIRRCRKLSVGVGLHTALLNLEERTLRRFIDAGMNWFLNGADIIVMRDAMNAQLRRLREIVGESQVHTGAKPEKSQVQSCIT
jgi:4-hydroxy-2-oxoheptanedioate aldolase